MELLHDKVLLRFRITPADPPPTTEAEDAWIAHVTTVASTRLYPLANSWHLGANILGKFGIFMPYVGGVGSYRKQCDEIAAKGYEGLVLSE